MPGGATEPFIHLLSVVWHIWRFSIDFGSLRQHQRDSQINFCVSARLLSPMYSSAVFSYSICDCRREPQQRANAWGMGSDWLLLACDTHEHEAVGPSLTYSSPVISPYLTTLPRRYVEHDAAQDINSAEYSSEQGYDLRV